MRLVTFAYQGETRIGGVILQGAQNFVLDFRRAQPDLPTDMLQFLRGGASAWTLAQHLIASPNENALVAEDDVTLMSPVPCPGKIICVGHNYHDHADPSSGEEYPTFFGRKPLSRRSPHLSLRRPGTGFDRHGLHPVQSA